MKQIIIIIHYDLECKIFQRVSKNPLAYRKNFEK